jgi:hypothetical protein
MNGYLVISIIDLTKMSQILVYGFLFPLFYLTKYRAAKHAEKFNLIPNVSLHDCHTICSVT